MPRIRPPQLRALHPLWRITREVAAGTWEHVRQAQLFQVASSLAYTTILSIIPLLAMSFAVFKAFGGMERLLETIQPFILSNLAQGTSEEVLARIEGLVEKARSSTMGAAGFLGLIATSISMLSSVENAINRVWSTKVTRSWFQRVSSYWLLITLGPVALGVALGAATSSRGFPVARLLPSGAGVFALAASALSAAYKFVPNVRVRWRHALVSGLAAAAAFNLARAGYAFYTRKMVSYDRIYGSLAAVPILLLWIYILWVIVLAGAALTAALQRRGAARTG